MEERKTTSLQCAILFKMTFLQQLTVKAKTFNRKFFSLVWHTRWVALTSRLGDTSHLFILVIFVCFLLSAWASYSFIQRVVIIKNWKEKVLFTEAKIPLLETLPLREKELAASVKNHDPFYLEHTLGNMRLSRLEAYSLESSKDSLSEVQKKRLHFLMGKENSLLFSKGKMLKGPSLTSQEIKQEHPVEVDETDIQRILAHLEGVPIGAYTPSQGRPPLTIKKFSLKRKKETSQGFPSYSLDMELWKREAAQTS